MITNEQLPFQKFRERGLQKLHQEDGPYAEKISRLNISGNTSQHPQTLTPTDIIHFIWLGAPFAEQKNFSENVLGFKKRFPEMTVILWTSPNPETNVFCSENNIILANVIDNIVNPMKAKLRIHYNRAARQIPPNYGMMSDILRYKILYEFGGLYLDVDVQPKDVHPEEDVTPQDPSRDHIFGGKSPTRDICISREYFNEEINWLNAKFNNDCLYSKNTKDPFWMHLIHEAIRILELPYQDQVILRRESAFDSFHRYRQWLTVIGSGPACLRRTIKAQNVELGEIPINPCLGAGSWVSGPVEFAKTYTPTSLKEEIDLLNRAILAVIDELPRGNVKGLHYLPLLDTFTHMTPQEAREKFFSNIEEALKNLPDDASPIRMIYVEDLTQHQRISKAIPKFLNRTTENHPLAALKILKIKGCFPETIHIDNLAQDIAFLEGKSLTKAFKIILEKGNKEMYSKTLTAVLKSNAEKYLAVTRFIEDNYSIIDSSSDTDSNS